jgi:uncharacterized protein YndB with AHSA1/START domain
MSVVPIRPFLEPLRKSVTVRRTPAEAFEIFTARLERWWPLARFSIFQEQAASCGFEPRVGGAVYEVSAAGERRTWGTLLAWEPPQRLVMTWHPGRDPDTAQEVELRFTAVAGGTRVDLEHRGWQSLGEQAAESREGYDHGWPAVLSEYAAECSR